MKLLQFSKDTCLLTDRNDSAEWLSKMHVLSTPKCIAVPLHYCEEFQMYKVVSHVIFDALCPAYLPTTASMLSPGRRQAKSAVAIACVPDTNCILIIEASVPITSAMICRPRPKAISVSGPFFETQSTLRHKRMSSAGIISTNFHPLLCCCRHDRRACMPDCEANYSILVASWTFLGIALAERSIDKCL